MIPYSGSTAKCGFSNLVMDQECGKLYANCLDNTIYCYNVSNYNTTPIRIFSGHENNTFYVKSCLSSDGLYLLSGSSDHDAYIWNTNYSEPIVKLTGHTAEVTCVAWYQFYDMALVTCSDDYRHKIWRIGSEILPDNWEFEGRGLAQKIISKRCLDDISTVTKIKRQKSCAYCNFLVDKRCENCNSNLGTLKRLPIYALDHNPKRLCMEDNVEKSKNEELDLIKEEDCDYINPKRIKLDEGESSTSTESILTTLKVTCRNNRDQVSPEPFSPTTNLPNFNVDGCAPHLNWSPQKKVDKDWLTKMRVERNLRNRVNELSYCQPPPKLIKLDNLSPRSRSLKRQNKVARCSDAQSPLLKYFRVTNSSILKDSQCVPRISLTDAALSEITCRDWFCRFKDGDFDVDHHPREGRPKTFEEALLDDDPCQTQQELSSVLGVTRQAIVCVGFLMIRSQGTLSVVVSPAPAAKKRIFFIASRRLIKNGFITATQRKESHGDCCEGYAVYLVGPGRCYLL
ncbi:hypothetical protein Trydic_g14635 [Trypoxylus dichotomus]